MANEITRTIKVYTYITGLINNKTWEIENRRTASYPYKLGARERRKLETIQGGQILGEPQIEEKLYGMSLDDFILHATSIDGVKCKSLFEQMNTVAADDAAAEDETEE